MRKVIIFLVVLLMTISMALADEVTTDRLNFEESAQHAVYVYNGPGAPETSNTTMPAGFSFVSSVDGCTNPSGQTVICSNIPTSTTYEFIISSPSSATEYSLQTMETTVGGVPVNNISFIRINDDEVFHTLVEYGRGRGNYFFDSINNGTGYSYLPNATDFELNYLHKIFNIKQYFSLATSQATDVSFTCTYPYHTVIREHLVTGISNDATDWTVAYSIPRIDGSWERMGFLGMDFDSGEYDVGETFTVNCTGLQYTLADAYGDVKVAEDSFTMEIRSPDPMSVVVSSDTATIGNGTSEVVVTYTFTNDEVYPLDALQLEIDAPEEAQFIGVRGELWGVGQDSYLYELTELGAGESISISLVARFDTSNSADTTLLLSQGINGKFIPTWEINAYNPLEYIQTLAVSDTQAVNYGVSSAITSLQEQLNTIEANTVSINNTVNAINVLVEEINSTTHTTGENLLLINSSLSTLIQDVNATLYNQAQDNFNYLNSSLVSLSDQMTTFESNVEQLVNCTANPSAPLCVNIAEINTTVSNIEADIVSMNTSLHTQLSEINSTIMTELETEFSNIQSNFTTVYSLLDSLNTTLVTEINNAEGEILANISAINATLSADIAEVYTIVSGLETQIDNLSTTMIAINSTLSSQITDLETSLTNLIDAHFAALNINGTEILQELDYMQDFNEELIFLVTDSVGMQEEAKVDFKNGDTDSAIDKLNAAAAQLEQANAIIAKDAKSVENDYLLETATSPFDKIKYWVKGLFL